MDKFFVYIKYSLLYFLFRISPQKEILCEDMRRWIQIRLGSSLFSFSNVLKVFQFPEYRSLLIYRHKGTAIGRIIKYVYGSQKDIYINGAACIESGFVFMNGFSSRGGSNYIGKNCEMWQRVTLGKRRFGHKEGRPSIGDNVRILPGACILGDVHIGDNVTIFPNTIVLRDIPNNCEVSGNPMVIMPKTTFEFSNASKTIRNE